MSDNNKMDYRMSRGLKSEWSQEQDELQAAYDRLTQKLNDQDLSHEERQQAQWALDDVSKKMVVQKKVNAFNRGTDKLNSDMANRETLNQYMLQGGKGY